MRTLWVNASGQFSSRRTFRGAPQPCVPADSIGTGPGQQRSGTSRLSPDGGRATRVRVPPVPCESIRSLARYRRTGFVGWLTGSCTRIPGSSCWTSRRACQCMPGLESTSVASRRCAASRPNCGQRTSCTAWTGELQVACWWRSAMPHCASYTGCCEPAAWASGTWPWCVGAGRAAVRGLMPR